MNDPKIFNERYSSDEESIDFIFEFQGVRKQASISRSALTVLGGARQHDLMWVFNEERKQIAKAAGLHSVVNPLNKFILLGTNDF